MLANKAHGLSITDFLSLIRVDFGEDLNQQAEELKGKYYF
jgi:hypothetical protein